MQVTTPGDNQVTSDFSGKLTSFREFMNDLQQKKLFDGEVLVAQGEKIIMHIRSDDVQAAASKDNSPQFLIGSVSKQFTAVALLKALYDTSCGNNDDEKYLYVKKQLHEPISNFLPADAVIWAGSMPTWANTVTLHHLLTHTSGIAQPIGKLFRTKGFDGVWNFLSTAHSPSELVSMCANEPVEFTPGSDYSYSNVGYHLLTEVVAALTKVSFAQYLQRSIFEPFGLTNTCHPQKGKSYKLKQMPTCAHLMQELTYNSIKADNKLSALSEHMYHDISNAIGAGSIVSCAQDLLKWNRALHEQQVVLPAPLYELLIQPNLKDYGYGICNRSNGVIHHNGKIGNYDSFLAFIKSADNLSIIVLSHVDYDEETVYNEFKRLDEELKKTIVDDGERQKTVGKKMSTDYPNMRGGMPLLDVCNNFVTESLNGK